MLLRRDASSRRTGRKTPGATALGYLGSLSAVAAATICGALLASFLDPTNIALLYLVAVVLSATRWGLGPSIVSSVVSVVLLDALFVPPFEILSISGARDLVTRAVFLLVAGVVSQLGSRIRMDVQAAHRREQEADALYELSREIAFVQDWSRILDVALTQTGKVFQADAVALLPGTDGQLAPIHAFSLTSVERRAAQWAFDHRTATGRGATVMREGSLLFMPLQTAQGSFGVLGLRLPGRDRVLDPDQRRLLETIAGQVAVALEHAQLGAQAEQARLLEETDRFRSALLSSLSHDLRTPLASIVGSVTSLMDSQVHLDAASRRDLLETIAEESARLNRLVANLLNMTRLESGAMKPERDWHSLEEVVGAALASARLDGREVKVDLPGDLPLAEFDFVLIEQVILNLLDNAVKFSPVGSPIEISAHHSGRELAVCVADRGIGIPAVDIDKVFDKFYRIPRDLRIPGTGLGLSICKGIVEAHGGKIWAEAHDGGGTCLIFSLPWTEMEKEK